MPLVEQLSEGLLASPSHETSFKQYLVDTFLQGIISQSEKKWLKSSLTFRSLLSQDQVNLIEHILDDIDAGVIQLVD